MPHNTLFNNRFITIRTHRDIRKNYVVKNPMNNFIHVVTATTSREALIKGQSFFGQACTLL